MIINHENNLNTIIRNTLVETFYNLLIKIIHRFQGASVYAIGVGERCAAGQSHGCYDRNELKAIASNPEEKFIFEINNFDQLILQRIGILSDVCEGIELNILYENNTRSFKSER